jgi:hypothetical protein
MDLERSRVDVSEEQRAATELIKRIRKLRWMGMEDKARRIVRSMLRICAEETVLANPPHAD